MSKLSFDDTSGILMAALSLVAAMYDKGLDGYTLGQVEIKTTEFFDELKAKIVNAGCFNKASLFSEQHHNLGWQVSRDAL